MLRRVRIRRWGVIEDATVDLSPGLTVLTGETGAGKTMVVSGLGLLFGARADSGGVRGGTGGAVVEGELDLPADHPAWARAVEAGADPDDTLVLVRTVETRGRSRAHVGGRAAPVGVLADIGEHVLAVHGQADQWRLRSPAAHRELVDTAAGPAGRAALSAYREEYRRWRELEQRWTDLRSQSVERLREIDMMRLALAEITRVAPQPGEEEDLARESARLEHADQLASAGRTAYAHLAGEDEQSPEVTSAVDRLGSAVQALETAAAHDEEVEALAARAREIGYLLGDLASDVGRYAAEVELDPARLEWVQQRRSELSALVRSYGGTTRDVIAWAQQCAVQLEQNDSSAEALDRLEAEVERARASVTERATELTAVRDEAGTQLASRVGVELAHLAMGSARIQVQVTPTEPGPNGSDEVEIQLAANVGSAARSVARAASGGELSRLMLALEVVTADGSIPTYVFDEVDAGVGGSAALDLGARLARLAETSQVVVVTHLGQVAAFADRHLVVAKSHDGTITASGVREVTGADRIAEVARMLGGVSDSTAALRHAEELISEHAPARLRT